VPIYEYECEACHGRFEVIQKFSDKPLKKCATCGGGPIARLLSPPALVFKGTGWYVTDYARSDRGHDKKKASGDSGGNGNGTKAAGESSPSTAAPSSKASSD